MVPWRLFTGWARARDGKVIMAGPPVETSPSASRARGRTLPVMRLHLHSLFLEVAHLHLMDDIWDQDDFATLINNT